MIRLVRRMLFKLWQSYEPHYGNNLRDENFAPKFADRIAGQQSAPILTANDIITQNLCSDRSGFFALKFAGKL